MPPQVDILRKPLGTGTHLDKIATSEALVKFRSFESLRSPNDNTRMYKSSTFHHLGIPPQTESSSQGGLLSSVPLVVFRALLRWVRGT